MSRYPDDQYDDDRGDRGPDPRMAERGRTAVRAPGVFLILTGVIGIAVCIAVSIPFVFDPHMFVRGMKDFAAQQPPGQQKQDLEKQADELEKQVNQQKNQMQIRNGAQLGVLAVLNLLTIAGGFSLRGLGSRGLSMAGAIVSLIPCVGGCCLIIGMPAGIWALIVLSRPDVKAAFAAKRSAGVSHPDDQYMR